jgi:hypothetical protein
MTESSAVRMVQEEQDKVVNGDGAMVTTKSRNVARPNRPSGHRR